MGIKKVYLAAFLMLFTGTGLAAQYSKEDIARAAANLKIQDIVPLPISGMKAISSKAGVIFISENGRFAFKGKLYDIWNGAQYASIDDIKENAFRIDLKKMRIDVDSLNTITLGQGNKEAVFFVDPRCPYCHRLIEQALSLQNEYTFKIVFLSILGKESDGLAMQVACAKRDEDVIPALLSNSLGQMDTIDFATCDKKKMAKTMLTGNVLGIRTVPYLLSPNGTAHSRLVNDLALWLKENS